MCDNLTLLLDRIKADPDDLTLRLAYSDELEEVGGEENRVRAELIRTMVDIHRDDPAFRLDWSMNSKVYDGSADERIRRTAALVRRTAYLSHYSSPDWTFLFSLMIWRRGFPEEFRGTVREWAEVGDRVCATGPVTAVEFKPFYWGDVFGGFGVPLITSDVRNDWVTAEVKWKVKGKQVVEWKHTAVVWTQGVAERFNDLVQREVSTRTVEVFRGWWPTVKEFRGIPTE